MWIPGDTALFVLADIEREEDAFNEWYDREHMRERVLGVPGYRVGRRYVALRASPKYLALYQCRPGALGSPAYRAIVGNPDARTQHFVPLMLNAVRAVTTVTRSFGEGEGSVLGLVTLTPMPGKDAALREFATTTLLPELAKSRGILAGALLESVPDDPRTTGVATLRRSARTFEWLVAIESGHDQHLVAAMRELRVLERCVAHDGGEGAALATFRLTYRISPQDSIS